MLLSLKPPVHIQCSCEICELVVEEDGKRSVVPDLAAHSAGLGYMQYHDSNSACLGRGIAFLFRLFLLLLPLGCAVPHLRSLQVAAPRHS